MTRRSTSVVGLIVWAVALPACGSSTPSRAEVIGAMTEDGVADRYATFAEAAAQVVGPVETWCDSGDPTDARAAVAAARASWVEIAPFWFGPSNDRRSMFIVDPRTRTDDVDALVASDQPVDPVALRELAGADQRGLRSLDHLLTIEPSARSCEYAVGLAELVAEEAAALADDWEEYGTEVVADDDSANVALRNIVSDSLFSVQMATEETSDDLVAARLAGVRWALIGDGDDGDGAVTGISDLLGDETVALLERELDAGDPVALEITISTNVVGELGTTINFSDADGDG